MHHQETNSPLSIDGDKPIKMPLKVLVGAGIFLFSVATGFVSVQMGVSEAKANAAQAVVKAEDIAVKVEAQLKLIREEARADHDTITRIDENVKILKEKQK